MVRAINGKEGRAKIAANSMDAVGNSPEEFAAKLNSEIAKWGKVIKDSGAAMQQ
jgi:tripartite-type tricarboxylate transporter receptor subunit TctC